MWACVSNLLRHTLSSASSVLYWGDRNSPLWVSVVDRLRSMMFRVLGFWQLHLYFAAPT